MNINQPIAFDTDEAAEIVAFLQLITQHATLAAAALERLAIAKAKIAESP